MSQRFLYILYLYFANQTWNTN